MNKIIYLGNIILTCCLFSCNSDEVICNPNEAKSCDTGLLIMTSDGSPGATITFTLDSIQKPVANPLVFNNLQTDLQPNFFNLVTRPSNYDAYNKINNNYFIEFPLEQRLYKYDINTQTRQELIVSGFYSAPIFNNGILYTITIDNNGFATNPANFDIQTINQSTGSLTNLVSGSFSLISSFDWESMSSATDNNGNVYFVSGTNLIKYNINSNTTQYVQLTPTFDFVDNFERYYGIEYRNNGSLLAIRDRDGVNGEGHELVEIDLNNLSQGPTVLFNFMANNIEINSEYYSTTYDPCDDKYYVTTLNNDFITSDFYELNLIDSTIKTENFPFYLMGIQSKFK